MKGKVHEFTLGGAKERLHVKVGGRVRPDSEDADDRNWLHAALEVRSGRFAGQATCSLRNDDFADFRTELVRLTDDRSATATFKTMEDQLGIRIKGDGRGGMHVTGHVSDGVDGNRLQFAFAADAGNLPAVLRTIDALLEEYPVR